MNLNMQKHTQWWPYSWPLAGRVIPVAVDAGWAELRLQGEAPAGRQQGLTAADAAINQGAWRQQEELIWGSSLVPEMIINIMNVSGVAGNMKCNDT